MNIKINTHWIATLTIALIFSGCSLSTAEDGRRQLDPGEAPEIGELLAGAEEKTGEEVSVKGNVIWVCESSGRSIFITDGSQYFRINAGPDISYFDQELEGKTVAAKGTLQMTRLSKDFITGSKENALKDPHRHEERKDHCNSKMHNLESMKEWIEANDKEYYPSYTMDASAVEIIE